MACRKGESISIATPTKNHNDNVFVRANMTAWLRCCLKATGRYHLRRRAMEHGGKMFALTPKKGNSDPNASSCPRSIVRPSTAYDWRHHPVRDKKQLQGLKNTPGLDLLLVRSKSREGGTLYRDVCIYLMLVPNMRSDPSLVHLLERYPTLPALSAHPTLVEMGQASRFVANVVFKDLRVLSRGSQGPSDGPSHGDTITMHGVMSSAAPVTWH